MAQQNAGRTAGASIGIDVTIAVPDYNNWQPDVDLRK